MGENKSQKLCNKFSTKSLCSATWYVFVTHYSKNVSIICQMLVCFLKYHFMNSFDRHFNPKERCFSVLSRAWDEEKKFCVPMKNRTSDLRIPRSDALPINVNLTHLSWKAWSSVPFNILFTQSSLTNLEGENSWSFWLLVYIILNDTLRYFTLLLCAGCQVAQITVIKWVIPLMGTTIIPTLLPVLAVLQKVVNGSTFEFKSIWIETSTYTTRALLWSHIQPISVQKSVAEFWLQMVSEISSSSAISVSASNRMYITQFIAIKL